MWKVHLLATHNPPATAGPNDTFLDKKSKHLLRIEKLKLELACKEADNICKQAI
jgi:hypothetical protein